ncbi:TPA: aminoglycoside phosphotransferase family protein, partial [Legionella pneumophila]
MNKNQLETICKKLNIKQARELPKRIYGGLLHRMWYLESNGSQFAIKQLNNRILMTEEVKFQYELTEEIAFQFFKRSIPAVHAIKTENNYLIFA